MLLYFSRRFAFLLVFSVLANFSCEKKTDPKSGSVEDTVKSGEKTYIANCIACHNVDPSKEGSVGPALAGTALNVIESKVLNGVYPEGYKPKRNTLVMQKFPHLSDKVPDIFAYLNSKK